MRFLDTTGICGVVNEFTTPHMYTGFLAGGFPSINTPINPITPNNLWNGNLQHLPAPTKDYSLQGSGNWPYNAIGHCSDYPFVWIESNNHEITIGCGTLDPAWISKVVFYLHGNIVTVTQQTQNKRTSGIYGYSITPQSNTMNGPALLTWDIYPVNGYVRRGSLYITLNSNPYGSNYYTRNVFYIDAVNGSDSYDGLTWYGPSGAVTPDSNSGYNSSTNHGPFKTIYRALTLGVSNSYSAGSTIPSTNGLSNDGALIYVEPNMSYNEIYNGTGCAGNVNIVYNNYTVNVYSRIPGQYYTITKDDRIACSAYGSCNISTSGITYTVANAGTSLTGAAVSKPSAVYTATTVGVTASGSYSITLSSTSGMAVNQNISVLNSGLFIGVASGTFITGVIGNTVILNQPTTMSIPTSCSVSTFIPATFIQNPNGAKETRYVVNILTNNTGTLDVPFLLGNDGISSGDLSNLINWKTNTSAYITPTCKTAFDGANFDMSKIIGINSSFVYVNSYITAGGVTFISNSKMIDLNGYAGPSGIGLFYTSTPTVSGNVINFDTPYTQSTNKSL